MADDTQSELFRSRAHLMVETQLRRRGITDERLLAAMGRVPRHRFAPAIVAGEAYEDKPLPIGENQTISQPYIVAAMLAPLDLQPGNKVLEIGTGSGYQTALLAELAREVYSVERIASLAERAQQILEELGYATVHITVGDGTKGLPAHAPFDRIVVSAAAPFIPPPLLEQLDENGRMIIPVGSSEAQELLLLRKEGPHIVTERLEACRFVPLLGTHGFTSGG